jgi:hypothetical protein
MRVPMFDIFSGRFGDADALWLEAVEGLGNAADRMKVLAAEKPGPYFVFSTEKRIVVMAIESSARQNRLAQRGDARQAG